MIYNTRQRGSKIVVGLVVGALFLCILDVPAIPAFAQQDVTDCPEKINEAEQLYTIGRFDEAINILTRCIEGGTLRDEDKMRAYRLLGLSYIAKDFLEDARSAIRKLLEMVPHYMPDPIQDPPPFTRLVEEVKEQREEELDEELRDLIPPPSPDRRRTMWMIVGGGALAVGGLVAILVSGGKNGPPTGELPAPPDLP
jgi:tetratricopeptide (TPR) repeat protein